MIQLILPLALLFSGWSSEGAVILKKRNKQALLHLEGLETRIGTYFEVVDFKGKSRGVLQIRRLSKNRRKAIGVLKSGQMARSWALEPISRWAALKRIKRPEKGRQALLKKRRSVRKLAGASRRSYRKPSKRRTRRRAYRQPSRYLANMNEDIQEESDYGNRRNEQYVIDDSSSPPPGENYYNSSFLKESEDDMNLTAGFSVMPNGNFMKLKYEDIHLAPSGMGFSGQGFLEGDLNDSFRWSVHAGYRRFSVFSEDDFCDGGECFLQINYITGGAGVKYILKEKKIFKLWGGIQANLMFLLDYANEINISFDESSDEEDLGNVTITDDSFGMLHGSLGLSLGVDILFKQNFVIPLALEGHFIIPPTATVTAGTVGFRLGVGWKF